MKGGGAKGRQLVCIGQWAWHWPLCMRGGSINQALAHQTTPRRCHLPHGKVAPSSALKVDEGQAGSSEWGKGMGKRLPGQLLPLLPAPLAHLLFPPASAACFALLVPLFVLSALCCFSSLHALVVVVVFLFIYMPQKL